MKKLTTAFIKQSDLYVSNLKDETVKYYKSALKQGRRNASAFIKLEELTNGHLVGIDTSNTIFKEMVEDMTEIPSLSPHIKYVALEELPHQLKKLANFLGIEKAILEEIFENGVDSYYDVFKIPKKSGGHRTIEAPKPILKGIQERILYKFLYKFKPSDNAYGFIKKRSIADNAKRHIGNNHLLKIDLKNFFPSVTRDMMKAAIFPILRKESMYFIQPLIDLCTLEGRLPQGAPTSPAWSNIVLTLMDYSMSGLANKFNMTYTRYADDLCLSSNNKELNKMIPIIRNIIESFGLKINSKKLGFHSQGRRMTVTGIIVNNKDFVSVPRHKRMKLRAKLHNIITGKTPIDSVNYAKLNGDVAFISMVNKTHGDKFQAELNKVREMLGISQVVINE